MDIILDCNADKELFERIPQNMCGYKSLLKIIRSEIVWCEKEQMIMRENYGNI